MQRCFRYSSFILTIVLCALVCFAKGEAAGEVQEADFSYQNIALGDSEEFLREQWGAPSSEKTQSIWGIHLKSLTYGDIVVSIATATGKVADINLIGEKYHLRKDIRYGTTSGYLFKAYGKTQRQLLDGHTCYIYEHPSYPHRHLVLNIDAENGSLLSARITMLPLTDEEADEMALADDESFVELDLRSGFIASKAIDVSNLPKAENAQFGGYGK